MTSSIELGSYISHLKEFVNREQTTQNKEIIELWSQPIGTRIAEGECIENLVVTRKEQNYAVLRWTENLSKFRIGDAVRLNQGDPQNNFIPCEIIRERENEMVVKAGYQSSIQDVPLGSRWVLDRDIVDVREIQLGMLDSINAQPNQQQYFWKLLTGKFQPIIDSSRFERALRDIEKIGFNPSQAEAFAKAYAANNYYLIQGPPGTGKTWVLAHLATKLASEGQRVLITAFTHRAINIALLKIAKTTHYRQLAKIGQQHNAEGLESNPVVVENFEYLSDSPYTLESHGVVLGATCFALRTKRLQEMVFDTVIFDEAGQMTLPLALIGINAASKAIFIGDHMQMAPVITAEHSEEWVSKSIFETLFPHSPGTMLDITYRMNERINRFPSHQFYNARLKCHPDVADHRLKLKQKPRQYASILDPDQPDVFVEVNHANRGMRSPEEASLAAGLVAEAIACGVPPKENAVVAPYRAQGRLIRQELQKQLKGQIPEIDEIVVDTVERIQGQEREIIIVSLTTSDPGHAAKRASFYFQPNRLNVAITRPRVKRIILGSPVLFHTEPKEQEYRTWVRIFYDLYMQSTKVSAG